MENICQCYKNIKQLDTQCPRKALTGSNYCGLHKNARLIKLISQTQQKKSKHLN